MIYFDKLVNLKSAFILGISVGLFSVTVSCSNTTKDQENYKKDDNKELDRTYSGGEMHKVLHLKDEFKSHKPKNIIFMIGDGTGIAQIQAGLSANGGKLNLENFKHVGFSRTQSADHYVTDSAAGGTALACGTRTYNGAIGVDVDKKPLVSVRDNAESRGLSTGLVATSTITHATPASFIAHEPNRNMYEEIAEDFLKTDIDVFIGGGRDNFEKRKDGKNLTEQLKKKGYQVVYSMDDAEKVKEGKLAALVADEHCPPMPERGDMLPEATETAIDILDNNDKGFFLMVEGSQIDWGGHQNKTPYVAKELIDFDNAIGEALKFAAEDKETLIVITADHETGGMVIRDGDEKVGKVTADYVTGHHSGVMVPVFAFGPGAENFTGIMKNTDIPKKMRSLMDWDS